MVASADSLREGPIQLLRQVADCSHESSRWLMRSLASPAPEGRSLGDQKGQANLGSFLPPRRKCYQVVGLVDAVPGSTGDGDHLHQIAKGKGASTSEIPETIGGVGGKPHHKRLKEIRSQIRRKRRMNVDLARKTHSVDWRHGQIGKDSEIAGCTAKRRVREIGIERGKKDCLPTWEKQIQASGGLEKENAVGQAPGPRSEEGGPP